jgi:hypothetical protein
MLSFANMTNEQEEEIVLISQAVAWLRNALPGTWRIEPSNRQVVLDRTGESERVDSAIDVVASNGMSATLAVEAKRSIPPRDVDRLLAGLGRTIRALAGYIPVLIVAPWISPRTQELLAERRINYLDLTGNAFIRLDNPPVYIKSSGATRDPAPTQRGRARVRGPKAARLVRLLADVRPPYGVREIASATSLAPGYVSRLLDSLDLEALVERSRRGQVISVDIDALIRRWAESYDLFKTNNANTYVAPGGTSHVIAQLDPRNLGKFAITGSYAAVRLAAVAAPALLTVYFADRASAAQQLGLLPADEGANVALLSPFDPVVWERVSVDGTRTYAAPSQVAVDCLSGNGRMPAEGDAVLKWMVANESAWRLPSLDSLLSTVSL